MADVMNALPAFLMQLTVVGIVLCTPYALAAGDADLPDPMRPGIGEPPAKTGAVVPAAQDAASLQSVILRAGRKPVAIISGQTVELGGEIGGARVTRITDTEVVLQGLAGTEILRLTPAVDKRPVTEKRMASKKKPATVGNEVLK